MVNAFIKAYTHEETSKIFLIEVLYDANPEH